MDLVVGEIIYKHTAIEQWLLVRRHSQVGESKVQFNSSVVLVCNIYNLRDEKKKAKTVLDYTGSWRNKTNLQKRSCNYCNEFQKCNEEMEFGFTAKLGRNPIKFQNDLKEELTWLF